MKKHSRFGFSMLLVAVLLLSSQPLFSTTVYQIQQLKDKAARGDKRAQYQLGFAYMTGNSVDYNRKEALRWLRKSAAQNYYNAWYRLGEMHYDSVFGIHSYRRSYKWFFKPAIRNHGVSQYKISLLYFNGNGVTKSYSKALIWAARAKNNGVAHAAALVSQIQSRMIVPIVPPTKKIDPPDTFPSVDPSITSKNIERSLIAGDVLLIGKWNLNGLPSDYLPSRKTRCKKIRNKIRCISAVKKIRKLGFTASFKIVSLITNFVNGPKFTIRYRNKYTSVVYDKPDTRSGLLPQDNDTNNSDGKRNGPSIGLGDTIFRLSCQALKTNRIGCFKSDNLKLVFTKR